MNVEKYKELKDKFYLNIKNAELYNNYSLYSEADKLYNKCKFHFLENDIFVYSILINIDVSINTDFPTACLQYKEDSEPKYKISINPYFFLFMNSLHFEYALFLVLHEVYHFVMSHLFSRKGNLENKDRKIKNIAQDLASNSVIIYYFDYILKQKPEFFPIPRFGPYKDFPPDLSYEEYEYLLLQKKEQGQAVNGETVDEHDENEGDKSQPSKDGEQSDKGLDSDQQDILEQLKSIDKNDILDKCGKKPGKYSSSLVKNLINDRDTTKLNPKQILSFFVQKCTIKYQKMNSFRKVNKKYINVFPGRKVVRKPRIAIFVDQSGSVSDVLLGKFFTLIDQLHCELTMFDIIPFDYTVDDKNIQKVKDYRKPERKRTRTGGTNFQAVIDYANKSKYDGIIILTDLGCGIPTASKMSRIWISDVNVNKFGKDINLTL